MQSLLKDMLMGINLVTEGFMKTGDVIEYDGAYWQVTDIGLRAVKLKRLGTGDVYTVSARLLTQVHVLTDRMELIVPGYYHVPAEEMREVCREICAEAARHDEVREAEFLGTDAFRESQIDYRIHVICDPLLRDRARRVTLAAMQDVLAAHGIAVPFNQLDVHLDKEYSIAPPQRGFFLKGQLLCPIPSPLRNSPRGTSTP